LFGKVVPLLSAAIAGSFQFLIWPRKMFASVEPSRLRPLTP